MINIKKTLAVAATAGVMALGLITPALAASYTFSPWTYDPGNACNESATAVGTNSVALSKPCPTATNAAAGATLNNVSGLSTNNMTLSFDYSGYCGAGAPRFNVYLSDGSTVFLGCAYGGGPTGDNVSGTASFTSGNTYGGVLFPTGATVTGIDLVQDEQGAVTLSNISVNGTTATFTNTPSTKDQCKNNGWKTASDLQGNSFKNQGQCVSYFNHVNHVNNHQ